MDWWFELIEGAYTADIPHISGSSFIYGPITVYDLMTGSTDPFELCCYTNKQGKLSLLNRNYRNEESIKEAKSKLKGANSIVSVSLIGEPKHGSVKNKDACMYTLFINKDEKRATVIFRNSDVFKKLPIDVYWLQNCLMPDLGIENYKLDACFNSITLRAPFFYIYINAAKKRYTNEKNVVENILSADNSLVKAFLAWYNKPAPNYKSLERAGRRMRELEIYKEIEPFIKGAHVESI